jgi:hypothetical protein
MTQTNREIAGSARFFSSLLVILALIMALAGVMAVVFFGLSVLVISVVGWLWPSKDCPKAGGIGFSRDAI